MALDWSIDDEAGPSFRVTPSSAPPPTPSRFRRRRLIAVLLVTGVVVVGAIAAAERLKARRQLEAIGAEVTMTAELALRAARDRDAELFLALTGQRMNAIPRDPDSGVALIFPGLQLSGPPTVEAQPEPPKRRGGAVTRAEVRITFSVDDGVAMGRLVDRDTWERDKEGRWKPEASTPPERRGAVEFPTNGIVEGALILTAPPGEEEQAAVWAKLLAPVANAFCGTGSANPLEHVCPISVGMVGDPGWVAVVQRDAAGRGRIGGGGDAPGPWALVVQPPSSLPEPADSAGRDLLVRVLSKHVAAVASRISGYEVGWVGRRNTDDPLAVAASGSAGGGVAFEAALLETWLVDQGVVSEARAADTVSGDLTQVTWGWLRPEQSVWGPAAPADYPDAAQVAEAARSAAAHVVAAVGVDQVPRLLAEPNPGRARAWLPDGAAATRAWAPDVDAAAWMLSVLGTDAENIVASWPAPPEPFPADHSVLVTCGEQATFSPIPTGSDTFLIDPGATLPRRIDICPDPGTTQTGLLWAPNGRHLAASCSDFETRSIVLRVVEPARSGGSTPNWIGEHVLRAGESASVPLTYDPATTALHAFCCFSWSPDSATLSWAECCPAAARSLPVEAGASPIAAASPPATGSASTAPPWLADWATNIQIHGDAGFEDPPSSLHPAFSPDGRLVASLSVNAGQKIEFQVADAASGAVEVRFEVTPASAGDDLEASGIAFSHDGEWLGVWGRFWTQLDDQRPDGNFATARRLADRRAFTHVLPEHSKVDGWWPWTSAFAVTESSNNGITEWESGAVTVVGALDPETGDVARLWPRRESVSSQTVPLEGYSVDSAGRHMLVSNQRGELELIDLKKGEVVWRYGVRTCRPGPWQPADY